MDSFGHLLRHYRRQSTDPQRGGLLTQARFGELIGHELGDAGYSGAAVSDWEREQSKIHADDRRVLTAIISLLYQCGGLRTPDEANSFLAAGNYRALNEAELDHVFSEGEDKIVVSPPLSSVYPISDKRRKQIILLDKVEHFWVNGVLEKAVGEAGLLDVVWEWCNSAVAHPWQNVVNTAVEAAPTAVSQPIDDTFFAADRALLILGAPGSGKTMTLITLAQQLISRARADETEPLPVILNLVSWAEKRHRLDSWIVEELIAKYQIPRIMARQWLEDDELVLLLDGLDEVARRQQAACIQAINQFRQTFGLVGIVVCSRLDDYEAREQPLKLSGAIQLEPLSPEQIETYLTAVHIPLSLAHNPLLQEIGQSPLMLRVMSETGQLDTAVASLAADDNSIPQQLFDAYVNQMFARRGAFSHSAKQTKSWLARLAVQMRWHNQSIFLLEQIQPSWLPTSRQRRAFILASRLIDGFSLGFVAWMFWQLVQLSLSGFDLIWSTAVTNAFPLPVQPLSLALFMGLFLLLGLLVGVIDIAFYERRDRLGEAYKPRRRDDWLQTAVVFFVTTLASLLTIGLYRLPLVGLASCLFTGFTFALIAHFIHGYSYRSDIRTIEVLSWSWRGVGAGLSVGLLTAAIFEMIEFLAVGPTPIFRTVFSITLLFTLLGGLRGNRLPITSFPNQGIWLSAASALAAGAMFAIIMSLATAVFWSTHFGVLAGILSGWIAAALYGAGTVLNYLWLRLWLTWLGVMPARIIKFLDEAANHALLHKVGGGYMFMHRLLQDYFAAMPDGERSEQ